MPVNKPGSCFLDALEYALGLPAEVVAAYLRNKFPNADLDNKGYHSTYINIASLELFRIGISQIDACPIGYDPEGEPYNRDEEGLIVDHVKDWFGRPGFRCVVTGPATYGNREEHANAWNGQVWIDPVNPEKALEAPTVDIRSIWTNTIPPVKATPVPQPSEAEADSQEDSDVDPT